MKKWFLAALLLLVVSPVWALFCQYCGKPMNDDARFCPQCGKAATGPGGGSAKAPIVTQTPEMTPVPVVVPAVPATAQPVAVPDADLLKDYVAIDQYESLLTGTTTLPASTRIAERRYQAEQALARKQKEQASLNSQQARALSLMTRKKELLDQYVDAWKTSQGGPLQAQGMARKDRTSFALMKTNEMLHALKTQTGDASLLNRLDKQQLEMSEALRDYQVTSSYLRVDNGRMNRGQTFWIAEKQNGWARIVCLDTKGSPAPLVGWVSLLELSQRSTWRGEIPTLSYPPPAPVVMYPAPRYESTVIIIDDDEWHWRRRHPGRHWPHRRHCW